MTMALKKEELQIIGEYVQDHLTEWLPEHAYKPMNFSFPLELTERMIRVEEELKNQRELMKQGFDQIDKRIELQQINMDKRFEQVDKRFEQVEKRFESMQQNMNRNFDEVNNRLKAIETKMFQFMVWSSGFMAIVAGIVIAVIKFT
jgi:exonuclease VII large subunit